MKVLMITGDRNFREGHPRFELQKAAVKQLVVVYWGKGDIFPRISGTFDIVTVQDPFVRGLFGLHVARILHARFNVQVHADVEAHSFLRRAIARFVLKRADSIRVVSNTLREQVTKLGVHAPISVLPVFVEVERFSDAIHHEHGDKHILWVGRFEEEKNPRAALNVFGKAVKSVPDAKLIMLGSGSLMHAMKRRAEELPVTFPGWQDPLPYLEWADVVLCTSWHESFGASIIEALAAGVPVVAPDVGVAKEAGAIVVSRNKLASAVVSVLKEGRRGVLKMQLLDKDAWRKAWRETL